MRQVVAGEVMTDDIGCRYVMVWFRVAIPANATKPGRQAYYSKRQQGYVPQAPGNYETGGLDAAEVQDFADGKFVELPPISDPVDPADVAPASANNAGLTGRLKSMLDERTALQIAKDDKTLGVYGSYYDGGWNAGKA